MKHQLFSRPDSSALPEQATTLIDRSTTPTVVAIHGLTKRYEFRPVLAGVSHRLAAGRALALLGPNGAGKTTLLRILATLTKPSEGTASVYGADVVRDGAQVRRIVGYVGHQPSVYPDLTGLENLLFFARIYGLADGPDRARLLLERMGLQNKAHDRARTYSRGQMQRLTLARGLLHQPQLLLLDEPETGLDADAVTLLSQLMQERREAGFTSIFTTHLLDRGLAESDEALVLVGGRAVYAGRSQGLDVDALTDLYQQRPKPRSARNRPDRRALA